MENIKNGSYTMSTDSILLNCTLRENLGLTHGLESANLS